MKEQAAAILCKKSITIIIILILSVLFIISCKSSASNSVSNLVDNQDGNSDVNNETAETTTEDPLAKYNDGLGDYNFNGEEFKIQIFENENVHNHIDTAEETGDVFNDALYKRNRAIEQRFNVVIKEVVTADFKNDQTKKVILSGDSTVFDMFDSRCTDALTNWEDGLVLSYKDIPNIDLSKPYWNQSANKSLTLNNNQYVAIGNFNFASYELSHALLFNKGLIQDLGLDNPYNLVNGGTWTFDKMEEMMKSTIKDLNGDGVMDGNDRYGYLAHPKEVLPSFWIGAGVLSVEKDAQDIPYIAMGNQKFLDVWDRTFSMLWDSGAYYLGKEKTPDVPQYVIDMFSNNQSLFMDTTFFVIQKIRSSDTDFGIIPYPKYDETQANYVSRIEYYMAMQVPITNADPACAGVMLEALNSESAKTIMPAYYDIALKTKYARDDESSQMLDLIMNSLVVDIGDTTLCDQIRSGIAEPMFTTDKRDLVSKLESTKNIIQKFIDKIPG
ncbi:MAG: hypothetical protein FWD71_02615 [Oscillospiraceae bacterium]|nr:hypothetical protein [Oscillospiraceae bacterium]